MARSRDTMNRPDSTMLNSSAEPTVAAKAFEKAVKENSVTPAIATGFVPPVLSQEEKEPEVKRSPFRQIKTEGDESGSTPKKDSKPAIALGFIPMPGYMKKQEINPFKSNKGPVKRPASASINHAAVADDEENIEETVEEKDHSSDRPSLTAALAGHEVHSTFRPTEFKTQDHKDPFKRSANSEPESQEMTEAEAKVETETKPKPVVEKREAPKNRRSPFQTMRREIEPEPEPVKAQEPAPVEPEPVQEPEVEIETAPIAAEEPVAGPAPVEAVEPEPETVAAPDPEPEIEQSPFKAKEIEPEPVVEDTEPVAEPVVEEAPVQAKEPEPELVFPSYTDEDIDLEPIGDTSPFKPLDHEIDVNDEPAPQPQRSEPTFYTSGTEEKSRGGLLGGLFKKR